MDLFEKLFAVSDSADLLDSFLIAEMQSINDFYNSEYSNVLASKESIERFILFKSNIIEQLDYSKSYNKAFISILLDFCERYNFIAATPKIYSVLEKNDINIGHRLQAALLFLYNIDSIPTLISRYDLICQKLQTSIELEEDNDRKALSTFLNYYSIVILDTRPHVQYALEVKSKIEYSLSNKLFPFLNSEAIVKALQINLFDADTAFEQIQSIIDYLLDKTGFVKPVFEEKNILLIEKDTEYSSILNNTTKTFKSVRKISVNKINGITEKDEVYNSLGRGVAILESESQMYSYMNSFGSSHHAKMISALDKILFNEIRNDLEIFDWSCGQGLASMVFYEYLQSKSINLKIKSVTLIEPSNICLQRASLHVNHFDKNCIIRTVCKDIDSLKNNDIRSNQSNIKIHFFSNILDVEDFSISNLIGLIENTQKGLNYFVCVSPYITDTKADRVDSFSRHFSKFNSYELLGEKTSGGRIDDEYWNCNNKYKNCMCSSHPHTCNGKNKWTRVIRVFTTDFD
jgi:hypothetical protein